MGYLVYETVGWVRWRISLIPQAAIPVEILRGHQGEQSQVLDFYAIRWYSLFELRIEAIHLEDGCRVYHVSDSRRQKHNVRFPDRIPRYAPSIHWAVPYYRPISVQPDKWWIQTKQDTRRHLVLQLDHPTFLCERIRALSPWDDTTTQICAKVLHIRCWWRKLATLWPDIAM